MKATDFIMAAGSILAGIKTLADGFGEIAEATGRVNFKPEANGNAPVATSHHVGRDIKERIHHIKDMTQKGMRSPVVRAFAVRVLSSRCARCEGCKKLNVVTDIAKHINPRPGLVRGIVQGNEWVCGNCNTMNAIGKTTWCVPEKNWRSECEAIFEAVRSHIRYTRDIEGIDTYQHPVRTLEWGGGDCDDYTIVLASMLKSVGYPVKARTMEQRRTPNGQRVGQWGHILLIVGVPPQKPGGWLPLDASVDKPAGWYPPKQMIYRTQDFDL
ncbi:MAG: transglutaminase-like domain-containing protein [Nitrospirota bacterium]